MNSSAYQTNTETESSAILQRIAEVDKTAVKDCIDAYGTLVWAMVREQTDSLEESEAVVVEIFVDVWRYAAHFDSNKFNEITFVFLIARQRLIKRLQ